MTNNHLAPRTIREWLELIPFDRARKEAIENYKGNRFNDKFIKLSDALKSAFDWGRTPQSKDHEEYWVDLWASINNMEQSVKLKQ